LKDIRVFHRCVALILLTLLPALGYASPCKPQFEGAFWAEKDLRIVGLEKASGSGLALQHFNPAHHC